MSGELYYGDCLDVMRGFPDGCADLIYLDPPFNSSRDYNAFFKTEAGDGADAQITAFEDTWHWGAQSQCEFDALLKNTGTGMLGQALLPAMRDFLGNSDMMAYLTMMASRLVEMHRILNDTGSIYLHCDPTASHYLKIFMDAIFGKANFRNEIVWCYRGAGYPKKDFGRRHDLILRYSKTGNYIFNLDEVRDKYASATVERFKHKIGNIRKGKDFGGQTLNVKGRHPDDWWEIQPIAPSAKERLGYPTQKPLALLERIIKASSRPGDVVLDPFCGCGTAVHASEKLGRKWIGIDITHLAIGLIKKRIHDAFPDCEFTITGTPKDVESARYLAQSGGLSGRYQFQYWALSLIDAIPANDKKKGSDKGCDGYIWAYDSPDAQEPFKINISVKSGKIPANHIRELAGMLGVGGIAICVLITLEEPSRVMIADAKSYGDYVYPNGKSFPRVQILTIKELLEGASLKYLDYGCGKAMPPHMPRDAGSKKEQGLI